MSVGLQYKKIGAQYGIIAHEEKLKTNFFNAFKNLLIEHPNFGEKTIGWQKWWHQLVCNTFQNSLSQPNNLDSLTIDKIAHDLIEIYKTKECWKLREGAHSLLSNLSGKNVRLGVISNYDPRLENILMDLDIHKYFNFVLTSYSAKCQKPDPQIFKIVEDMNQDLNKEEILHVGDNLHLDFIGARNVGWNALLIAKGDDVNNKFPLIDKSWIVKGLSDIYQTLVSKNMI